MNEDAREVRSERGEPTFAVASRRHPRFQIAVRHAGLDRYQLVQARDPFAVEALAERLMAEWDAEWAARGAADGPAMASRTQPSWWRRWWARWRS